MGSRGQHLVLGSILLLGFLVRFPGLVIPWDGLDFHSAFACYETGAYDHGFYEHGFLDSTLLPFRWRLDFADGTHQFFYYTHHPALFFLLGGLLFKLLGESQWVLHLPGLIFSLLGILIFQRFVAAIWGTGRGLLAAALMAVLPMGAYYGVLPWTEVPIVWLQVWLLLFYVKWLRGGGGRPVLGMLGCVFLGGLFDWPSAFILPPLAAHLWWVSRREGRARKTYVMGALFACAGLAVGVHYLHLRLVLPKGSLAGQASTLTTTMSFTVPFLEFLVVQGKHLVRWFTWPGMILVVAGLGHQGLRALKGRLSWEQTLLFVLPWPALLYVFLFPMRSVNHDFFWFLLLPFVALLASLELAFLWRLSRPWRPALRLLLILALAAFPGWCLFVDGKTWAGRNNPRLMKLMAAPWARAIERDPHGVLLTAGLQGQAFPYFCRGAVICKVDSFEHLLALKRSTLARLPRKSKVWMLLDLVSLLPEAPRYLPLQRHLQSISKGQLHLAQQADGFAFELFDLTSWCHH